MTAQVLANDFEIDYFGNSSDIIELFNEIDLDLVSVSSSSDFSNLSDSSNSIVDYTETFQISNYAPSGNSSYDSSLSDNELQYICDAFKEDPNEKNNRNQNEIFQVKQKRRKIVYQPVNQIIFVNANTRNLVSIDNFFTQIGKQDYSECEGQSIIRLFKDIYHPKCLIRFKVTDIHARAGPETVITFMSLKSKAFQDDIKLGIKKKKLVLSGYYVYKTKFQMISKVSDYDSLYEFYDFISTAKDMKEIIESRENFKPHKIHLIGNNTMYVDPFTCQIVLSDFGFTFNNCD